MTKGTICMVAVLSALLALTTGAEVVVTEAAPKLSLEEHVPDTLLNRPKRQLLFPNSTVLQLNIGATVPTPMPTMACNWALQANFQLPWNRSQIPSDIFFVNSEYEGDTRVIRMKRNDEDNGVKNINDNSGDEMSAYDSDLRFYHFYQTIESILDSFGYEGRSCVLHTLCKLAQEPLHSEDNEDLVHELATFLLNPTNDLDPFRNDEEIRPYIEAYRAGQTTQDCYKIYASCSLDLVELFTLKY